jgi:hypothetical protein
MLLANNNITLTPMPEKTKIPVHAQTRSKIQVKPELSDFARSHVENWTPPVPIKTEVEALQSLKVSVCAHFYKQLDR